jgi:hypothetical protein
MKSCKNVGRKVLNQSLNCATDVFISDPNKRPDFRDIFERLSALQHQQETENNENPQLLQTDTTEHYNTIDTARE